MSRGLCADNVLHDGSAPDNSLGPGLLWDESLPNIGQSVKRQNNLWKRGNVKGAMPVHSRGCAWLAQRDGVRKTKVGSP